MFSLDVFHLLANNCTNKFNVFNGPISMKERCGAALLGFAKSIYYMSDVAGLRGKYLLILYFK